MKGARLAHLLVPLCTMHGCTGNNAMIIEHLYRSLNIVHRVLGIGLTRRVYV